LFHGIKATTFSVRPDKTDSIHVADIPFAETEKIAYGITA